MVAVSVGTLLATSAISAGISVAATVAANLIRGPLEADGLDQTLRDDQGEGSPLQRCYGQQAVCRPRVLWYRPFKRTSSSGNWLSGKQEEIDYFCDVALALCEAPEGGMEELVQLYAGGQLVYTNVTEIEVSSTEISFTKFNIKENNGDIKHVQLRVNSPSTGPDLTQFKAGERITVAGSNEAENNDNGWKVARRSFDSSGNTYLFLKNKDDKFQGESDANGGGSTITLTQNLRKFNKRRAKEVTFYAGDPLSNASPDPVIELHEGTGEVPNFKGICYVVIRQMKLNDWSGQLPELRAVVSQSSSAVTLASVVEDICSRELAASQIDVTGVTGTVKGLTLNPSSAKEMLEPLAISHDLMAQERGNQMIFFTRDQATTVAIDPDDLGAVELGNSSVRPFEVTDKPDTEIPSRVAVRYFDPQRDYDQGSHDEPQLNSETSQDERVIDLPLTLTGVESRQVAAKVLHLLKANRQRVKLPLPLNYAQLQENDIATWTDPDTDREWSVLIDRVDRRWDSLVVVEGIQEETSALSFDRTADAPVQDEDGGSWIPPDLQLVVADLSPRILDHASQPGLYWTVAREDRSNDFAEAALYKSPDDVVFNAVDSTVVEGTVGFCTTALGAATPGVWDEVSTVDVEVVGNPLENATKEEVESGLRNLCLIGNELVCFRTAFAPSGAQEGVYTLSGFLRGIGNTGEWASQHAATERVVMLWDASLIFLPLGSGDLGVEYFWKGSHVGAELEEDISQQLAIEGATLRPFPPQHIIWYRRNATAFTTGYEINWTRTSREPGPVFGSKGLLEPFERYRVRITNSSGVDVADPYTVTGRTNFNYTDNQRSSDGVGLPFYTVLSQWSEQLQDWGTESPITEIG